MMDGGSTGGGIAATGGGLTAGGSAAGLALVMLQQVPMGAGSRNCTGNECVTAGDTDLIKRWIDQGAQNN